MNNIIEIEESYPLREPGETVKDFASRVGVDAKDYKKLGDLGEMDWGSEFGRLDAGDAVKACYAENGFELTLLMLLYRINEKLTFLTDPNREVK